MSDSPGSVIPIRDAPGKSKIMRTSALPLLLGRAAFHSGFFLGCGFEIRGQNTLCSAELPIFFFQLLQRGIFVLVLHHVPKQADERTSATVSADRP